MKMSGIKNGQFKRVITEDKLWVFGFDVETKAEFNVFSDFYGTVHHVLEGTQRGQILSQRWSSRVVLRPGKHAGIIE